MTYETPEEIRAALITLDLTQITVNERLEALESALADATGSGDLTATAPLNWQYRNVYDWVEQWFVIHFRRSITNGIHWCARWWEHEEALLVLTALWRTWEAARVDTTVGIAKWLTTTAYPLLDRLWAADGTFRQCTDDRHRLPPTLAYIPASDERR